MNVFSFRDFVIPNPPKEWDLDSAFKAKIIQESIKTLAFVVKAISEIALVLCTAYALCKGPSFTAVLLSSISTPVILTTVCVVSFILFATNIANRTIKGLTSEMLLGFAVEQLKKEIIQLKNNVQTDNTQTNSLCSPEVKSLLKVLFRVDFLAFIVLPMSPSHFIIVSDKLTLDQIQELLEVAYENEIVLEFSELSSKKSKNANPGDLDEEDIVKMRRACHYAEEFIRRRCVAGNIDPDKINLQLNALGYKFGSGILKSPLHLEDSTTLVFRPPCKYIGDLKKPDFELENTIKLGEYFNKIVIYKNPQQKLLLEDLSATCEYTLIDDDEECRDGENYSIWQKNPN